MNETAKKLVGLFGDKSLTAAQFSELIKDMKFGDLESGEYMSTAKHTAEIAELKKENETANGEITNLKKANETANEKIAELESKIKILETQLNNSK